MRAATYNKSELGNVTVECIAPDLQLEVLLRDGLHLLVCLVGDKLGMQDLPLLVELLDPLFQDEFDLLLGRELIIVEELGLKLVLDAPNSN
jgi:hypothetical protein